MTPQPTSKPGRGRFTIAKETTHVTSPIDCDGYPDYVAALNERLRVGVAPNENADVLIWKAVGPRPGGNNIPDQFFQLLGIERPPENGPCFVSLADYARKNLGIEGDNPLMAEIDQESAIAAKRGWKATEFPRIAKWLEANDQPLAAIVETTERDGHYCPLVATRDEGILSGLTDVWMPAILPYRGLALALAMRALLRAAEGKMQEAWRDLLACHRLAQLVAKNGSLVQGLVGCAIEQIALRADLSFLEMVKDDSKCLEHYSSEWQRLPPPVPVADQLDLFERFMFLEMFLRVDRKGLGAIDNGSGISSNLLGDLNDAMLQGVDWDLALESANHWFDRIISALRIPDRKQRESALNGIQKDIKPTKTDSAPRSESKEESTESAGASICEAMIGLMYPSTRMCQATCDRTEQLRINVNAAWALERFRLDHGAYPSDLSLLAPSYLASAPKDLFSGNPLLYKPTENGYLLYSVGPNGVDDDGRGIHDDPMGDDIAVKMPVCADDLIRNATIRICVPEFP